MFVTLSDKVTEQHYLVLRHLPVGLNGQVSVGFLDELKGQARVRGNVHQQLLRPVREETLPAKLAAELRVNMDDLHAGGTHREITEVC